MGYVEHVLQPGETLVHKSKLHWLIYLPVLPFLAILVLGLALYWGLQANGGDSSAAILPPILLADRRVIFKRGLIRRHTVEMNMDKVESVDVDQSILGRIFNYGDVTVRGTGASIEPLRMIDDPLHFRSRVTAR